VLCFEELENVVLWYQDREQISETERSLARELAEDTHRDAEVSSLHSSDSDSSPMSITSRASFLDELHEHPQEAAEVSSLSSSSPRSVTSADSFLCEMHESGRAALQEVVGQRGQAISPAVSDMVNRFHIFGEANQLGSKWYCLSCCRRRAECGHTVPGLDPPGLQSSARASRTNFGLVILFCCRSAVSVHVVQSLLKV
jgi:hypothetical protein